MFRLRGRVSQIKLEGKFILSNLVSVSFLSSFSLVVPAFKLLLKTIASKMVVICLSHFYLQ